MSVNIHNRYMAAVARGAITRDAAQEKVALRLRELALAAGPRWCRRPNPLLSRLGLARRGTPPKGIYLWGGVGRGKTFLMDLFCQSLPGTCKLRAHFHVFMQRVHRRLAQLQGVADPLEAVAEEIAAEAGVLCFDEFFVSDIGDAMLLGGLLKALFRRKIILVATSNIPPAKLYENGLQRERFLPAIGLLETNCAALELASPVDYRLRSLEQATLFHHPVTAETGDLLGGAFENLATGAFDKLAAGALDGLAAGAFDEFAAGDGRRADGGAIRINGRDIAVRRLSRDVVWFDFSAICEGPRSAADYVEIAKLFHAVIIGDVPRLGDAALDTTRRFINLIDAFYDCRVKLILSARAPITALYSGDRLAAEFERTRSRLLEMQSRDYLGRGHRV